MSARVFILAFMILRLIYDGIETALEIKQRKKPLPAEVADVYDADRYAQFLAHETDINKLYYGYQVVSHIIEIPILFSTIFAKIEQLAGGNVYLIFLGTQVFYWLISTPFEVVYSYLRTFKIEEKYGLNKKDMKEFIKDELIDELTTIVVLSMLLVPIYIFEHLSQWTNNFNVSWKAATLFGAGVVAVIVILVIAIALFNYFMLKKRYTFIPLSEGELKDKITALLVGCKKKISGIYVYNESKKSVDKNAFLLRLLWHREFGIADNFIDGNSERELLAVLSHEIGHLKHKKNWLNYLGYVRTVAEIVVIVALVHDPSIMLMINAWVRESFGLTVSNYYILVLVYGEIIKPITFASKLFGNWVSRREEDEADFEAVKNGYGEDLIATFKKLSTDELVDVYPHPVLEFIEDDHPSMYRRIATIRRGINSCQFLPN